MRPGTVPNPASVQCWSTDIFETLLVRPYVSPADLHEVCWVFMRRHLPEHIDAPAWRDVRVAAEQSVRRAAAGREVSLDEIYEVARDRLQLDAQACAQIQQCEVDQELRVLSPVQLACDLLTAARGAGTRIAFLSDMYLPADVIGRALERHGLRSAGDILLVSSASGKTKRSGALFSELMARTNCKPSQVSHVGDNQNSDYKVPLGLGLRASHFTLTQLNRYERAIVRTAGVPHLLRSAIAGASRATRLTRNHSDLRLATIREVSASVAGPLLVGFVLWALVTARQRGIRRLNFLARDGQILQRVAMVLAPHFGIEVECNYLLASRQALSLAALASDFGSALEVLARMARGQSVEDFARSLHLPVEALVSLGGDSGPHAITSSQILNEVQAKWLVGLLLASSHADHVRGFVEKCRAAMCDYFDGANAFDGSSLVIVDVGWQGNLQNFLARALRPIKPVSITGLYFGLSRKPPAEAGDVATYASQASFFNAELIELMCAADHGTVTAYVSEAEMPATGKLATAINAEAIEWGLREQHDAIEEYARRFAIAVPRDLLSVEDLPAQILELAKSCFMALVRTPSHAEAEVYGSFLHSTDASHRHFREIGPVLSVTRSFGVFRHNSAASHTHWPHATLMRSLGRFPMARRAASWILKWRLLAVRLLKR